MAGNSVPRPALATLSDVHPLTIRVAESRGYAISYADAGDGPAVVLVNGFASPAAEWRKFGYVDRLADRYRVLVVDSLGHGQSAMPHDADAYRAPTLRTSLPRWTPRASVALTVDVPKPYRGSRAV